MPRTRRRPSTQSHNRDIGLRVAEIRRARGITQVELADKLGISQAHVSDYERGRVNLTGDTIILLTKVLKVSADEILGLKPPPAPSIKDHRLLERIALIEKLPKRKRDALLTTIKTYLSEAHI